MRFVGDDDVVVDWEKASMEVGAPIGAEDAPLSVTGSGEGADGASTCCQEKAYEAASMYSFDAQLQNTPMKLKLKINISYGTVL